MPTLRVSITFNRELNSARRGYQGWLRGGDPELLDDGRHVFSVRRGDGRPWEADQLAALHAGKRWFHFEFWRDEEGVERYGRIAVFGTVRESEGEQRLFIQRLTDAGREGPAAPDKDIRNLEGDLRRKAAALGGGPGEEIGADMSWHELEQSELCTCFKDKRSEEDSGETQRRLQSLSLARPVGRIYYMYCFSLADYFKSAAGDQLDFTEKRKLEKEVFDFYLGDDCRLEDPAFGLRPAEGDGAARDEEARPPFKQAVLVRRRERQVHDDGMDFSLFRTKLSSSEPPGGGGPLGNQWLVDKTYRYRAGSHDEYFLRLSQTGLIEVRQERLLGGDDKSLAKILEELLRFRSVDTKDAHGKRTMSHELNGIVEEFAERVIEGYAARAAAPIAFEPKRRRQRDRRYVVILLRDLRCGSSARPSFWRAPEPCGRSIRPSHVHRNIEVVSSFLDGTMTYAEDSNELKIPARPPRASDELPDLSNWSDELCFFESDRALIYFEPKTILESYDHVANYEAYWRAIVRGVEHQLSIRTCLQNMETETTRLTERIPGLLTEGADEPSAAAGVADRRPAEPDQREGGQVERQTELNRLASDVSKVVSLLPKLRQISTTATAFRSGKAIHKFDRLGRVCFQFPELVKNIQQNVNELGDFLQYAKAQELRGALLKLEREIREEAVEEKRRDDKLVLIGLFIAASSILFTSFSFLIDADSFFNKYRAAWVNPLAGGLPNSRGTKVLLIYLALCTFCLILTWYLAPRHLGRRLKRAAASAGRGRPAGGEAADPLARTRRVGAVILLALGLLIGFLFVVIVRG